MVGIVWGCSHPHNNRQRDNMHTIDRQAEQLAIAGIDCVPKTNSLGLNRTLKLLAYLLSMLS